MTHEKRALLLFVVNWTLEVVVFVICGTLVFRNPRYWWGPPVFVGVAVWLLGVQLASFVITMVDAVWIGLAEVMNGTTDGGSTRAVGTKVRAGETSTEVFRDKVE